ncbi:MAG: OsmC family protein [Candidatus Omnitrophica bacterium]|nr:OsmC family protein [Candidatus Omnitrophota bacterium]
MGKAQNKNFIYQNHLVWQGERKGLLSSSGKPDLEVATPPEFRGHPGRWTPEDLFVASINICIMTTFLFFAEKRQLPLLSYKSEGQGKLEKIDNKFMFSEIQINLQLKVEKGYSVDTVKEILALSEKNCLISNSIKAEVVTTCHIEHE